MLGEATIKESDTASSIYIGVDFGDTFEIMNRVFTSR